MDMTKHWFRNFFSGMGSALLIKPSEASMHKFDSDLIRIERLTECRKQAWESINGSVCRLYVVTFDDGRECRLAESNDGTWTFPQTAEEALRSDWCAARGHLNSAINRISPMSVFHLDECDVKKQG